MKKVLILTASPNRDEPIDLLIAKELTKLGCEPFVRPCLRQGRDSVLDLKPDIVVLPPIRNPYARDFAQACKDFGCAVITRHTEASCDWQDYKQMDEKTKTEILGAFRYNVDCEIVWGGNEADILKRRTNKFPVISVGSFVTDIYKDPDIIAKYLPKEALYQKHSLDINKRTILILSAWGFIDNSPDLSVDPQIACTKDEEGRKIWLEMIAAVKTAMGDTYNILVTLHPNVAVEPYRAFLAPLGIQINTENKAIELVKNCDVVIHAGSTTAIGAHILNKPCIQYGDQNKKGGWEGRADTWMSKISPFAKDLPGLIEKLKTVELDKTNANPEAIIGLENGRFGLMDGRATVRAAEIINRYNGKFTYCWPNAPYDYDQLLSMKDDEKVLGSIFCGVCKKTFRMITPQWLNMFFSTIKPTPEQITAINATKMSCCPYCGARYIGKE